MVQLSCTMSLGGGGSGGIRKVNLCPTDYGSPGPLLMFMQHYYNPTKLSAHRFVILADMWGREVGLISWSCCEREFVLSLLLVVHLYLVCLLSIFYTYDVDLTSNTTHPPPTTKTHIPTKIPPPSKRHRLRPLDSEGEIYANLIVAVIDEVWQAHLHPVYRAILFGFDDIPEIFEDTLAPLCMDHGWL